MAGRIQIYDAQGMLRDMLCIENEADLVDLIDEMVPGLVEGDILYHDGTQLVRLPKGTAAQTLKMNAGATAPEWVT